MGAMTLIHSGTDTATDNSKDLNLSAAPGSSQTGKFLIHVKAVTGDWTIGATYELGSASRDLVATVANMTATGIFVGTPVAPFNAFGNAIPKPTNLQITENSAGSITADYYWLSGD